MPKSDDPRPVGGAPGDRVTLTDLEVITRYSLALRTATVDRAELVRVLRDDLEWLTAPEPPSGSRPPAPRKRGAPPRRPAR